MKKLLLTGSNGFIGSYFIKHYAQKHAILTFSPYTVEEGIRFMVQGEKR